MEAHTVVAVGMGMILAPLVVAGLGILLWRRITDEHVRATTVPMDVLVVLLILVNGCTGLYQAYVAHFPVFVTVGPWLRGLVAFRPEAVLMESVPLFLQIHVVSAFTLFALIAVQQIGAYLQRAGHIRAASVPDLSEAVCRTLKTLSAGVF